MTSMEPGIDMDNQLEVLKNSKPYILNDLNRYVFQHYYVPSKVLAKDEINKVIALDTVDNNSTPSQSYSISTKSLDLVDRVFEIIRNAEGYSADRYIDKIEGKSNWLIGYGQQIFKTAGGWETDFRYFIPDGNIPITKAIAEYMLETKVNLVATEIKAAIAKNSRTNNQLNKQQFSAIVEVGYNIGVPRLLGYKLMQHVYEGNFQAAAGEFSDITNGGLHGLVVRRQEDVKLFNS
jgi:GH24 family phage-related lysozyme (muramidase)